MHSLKKTILNLTDYALVLSLLASRSRDVGPLVAHPFDFCETIHGTFVTLRYERQRN